MTLETQNGTEGGPSSRITTDVLPRTFVAGIQQAFSTHLYNPEVDPTATDRLVAARQQWAQESELTTVFTTGVFDLHHLDHSGYILHTKLAGAAVHFATHQPSGTWEALSESSQFKYAKQVLSAGKLKLIVSVDGDRSVAVRKGNNPEKGGGTRPIFGWANRALTVAGLSVLDPLDPRQSRRLNVADAVTVHGPDDFDPDSPHHTTFDLAQVLQPDAWVIFGESMDIIAEAPERPELANIALRCIEDLPGAHYFEDPLVGRLSTTAIARRINGHSDPRV